MRAESGEDVRGHTGRVRPERIRLHPSTSACTDRASLGVSRAARVGSFGIHKERCLAEERAKRNPHKFTYEYSAPGGWIPVTPNGRKVAPPVWPKGAARGGR